MSASLEMMIRSWEGETVVIEHDRPTGTWILIPIHSTRRGPSGGGTRMLVYPELADALGDGFELARSMTCKFAIADLPMGGAKGVLAIPPDLDPGARPDLLRRYGALVRRLGGLFSTGPDLGTSAEDMDVVGETGSPHIFGRTERAGGSGGSTAPTALGLYVAVGATLDHLFGDPDCRGRRILIQGYGGVGSLLADRLLADGAEVLVSEIDEAALRRLAERPEIESVPPAELYATPCDLFSPCALGGVLNRDTVAQLRCRAVAGAANNQLAEPGIAEALRERGILYAPDYAINAGGATAVVAMEKLGWSRQQAEEKVRQIGPTLANIYATAEREGITTEAAAQRIVEERLAVAAQ